MSGRYDEVIRSITTRNFNLTFNSRDDLFLNNNFKHYQTFISPKYVSSLTYCGTRTRFSRTVPEQRLPVKSVRFRYVQNQILDFHSTKVFKIKFTR
jgi:hypothetical protein